MKKSTIIISLLLIFIILLICTRNPPQRYTFVALNEIPSGILIDQKTGKFFYVTILRELPRKIKTKEIEINWDGHKKNQ